VLKQHYPVLQVTQDKFIQEMEQGRYKVSGQYRENNGTVIPLIGEVSVNGSIEGQLSDQLRRRLIQITGIEKKADEADQLLLHGRTPEHFPNLIILVNHRVPLHSNGNGVPLHSNGKSLLYEGQYSLLPKKEDATEVDFNKLMSYWDKLRDTHERIILSLSPISP